MGATSTESTAARQSCFWSTSGDQYLRIWWWYVNSHLSHYALSLTKVAQHSALAAPSVSSSSSSLRLTLCSVDSQGLLTRPQRQVLVRRSSHEHEATALNPFTLSQVLLAERTRRTQVQVCLEHLNLQLALERLVVRGRGQGLLEVGALLEALQLDQLLQAQVCSAQRNRIRVLVPLEGEGFLGKNRPQRLVLLLVSNTMIISTCEI